jgi:2-polyprenyl-6-methoxyphenol hydroxylase-like FAD-dependent oxidoreductase
MKSSGEIVDRAPLAAGASVLVSGASFAGLATAFWMKRLGYDVTVVEIADRLRKGGTPVDIEDRTVDIVRRMGLLDAIRARSLPPRATEFKTADDVTEARLPGQPIAQGGPDERHEIDRDELLTIMFGAIENDVDVVFSRSIIRLDEGRDSVMAWFDDGSQQAFSLVFGCDGHRSNTRRLVFGSDDSCSHFLKNYFLIKVVGKSYIRRDLSQIHSVPGKTVMLNSYDGKTDIVFGFHAENEVSYNHRDKAQQRRILRERFERVGWRTADLLSEIDADDDFYFDKLCQIRMPCWTKGRVALVGDAGYCASPAAGMGGSLAIIGAAALAEAFERHGNDVAAAFRDYDESLRPFVDAVQMQAVTFGLAMFAPKTEADIIERNRRLSEL